MCSELMRSNLIRKFVAFVAPIAARVEHFRMHFASKLLDCADQSRRGS